MADNILIKDVSLKFFHSRLKEDVVFQRYEKLRYCCCGEYGSEMCQCTEESCSKERDAASSKPSTSGVNEHDYLDGTDGVDGAEEEISDDDSENEYMTIDETDDADATHEMHEPRMVHIARKLFNRVEKQSSTADSLVMKKTYVLIISNISFKRRPAPRSGGTADLNNILDFCDYLRIPKHSVFINHNLTKKDMTEALKKVSKDETLLQYDSFMCFIMSHGNKDGVLGTDNKSLAVENILELFKGSNCCFLITKPKLFFIQACRGRNKDSGCVFPRGPTDIVTDDEGPDDHDHDHPIRVPSDADIMVAYSTTKGNVSLRSYSVNPKVKTMGSWFIYTMMNIFRKYSNKEDLLTMMVRVNRQIADMYSGGDKEKGLKQMACQVNMLRQKLYFGKQDTN